MHLIDEFGFLRLKSPFNIGGYRIQIIPKYEQQISIIGKYANKDGYYYPPIIKTYKLNVKTNKKSRNAYRNTARPASIFRVAVTHQILCESEMSSNQFRESDGHFILSFLGFLYNTRLQFWNWWWEGRINIKQEQTIQFSENQLPDILTKGLTFWKAFSLSQQKTFLNASFLYQRGKALEWPYEQFLHYYICLDAIWYLENFNYNLSKKRFTHKERIITLCQKLNIIYDNDAVDLVYKTRNDLFHEGLFGSLNPLSRVSPDRYEVTRYLDLLIERMLIAILGFKPKFLSAPWWEFRGWQLWD